MKILLLSIYYDGPRDGYENIPMCALASYLRKHEYEVKIIMKKEFLIDYDAIVDYNPHIIGVFVNDTNKSEVYGVGNKIRQVLPEAWLCLGGLMPSCFGKEMLDEGKCFDFAVKGVNEYIWLNMVRELEKGANIKDIQSLVHKDEEAAEKDPIDDEQREKGLFSLLARDLLTDNKLEIAQITASRGCAAGCTFCGTKLFWGKCRDRDVKDIIDEMKKIVNKYNIHTFNFVEGSLDGCQSSYQRVSDIAAEIISSGMNIVYYIHLSGDFAKKIDSKLMQLFRDSGMYAASIGFESGNAEDLQLYGKSAAVQDYDRVIGLFEQYGICIEPGFINFNPYSTISKLRENVSFLERHSYLRNIQHIFSAYKLMKGTDLYHRILSDNLLIREQFHDYGYNFCDREIGRMFSFIHDSFMTKSNEAYKKFELLPFYTGRGASFINYYKRQFEGYCSEGMKAVEDFEAKNKPVIDELEYRISHWYKGLIALAENGWDNGTAADLSRNYININYINHITGIFHKNIDVLNYKLLKLKLKNVVFYPPVKRQESHMLNL